MLSPWVAAAKLTVRALKEKVSLRSLAFKLYGGAPSGFRAEVKEVALGALRNYLLLDRLLKLAGLNVEGLPLERLCSARVLVYLLKFKRCSPSDPRLSEVAKLSRIDSKALKLLGRLEVEDAYADLTGLERLSIKYSTPMWILEALMKAGAPKLEALLKRLQRDPARWLRVSTHLTSREELAKRLSKRGFKLKADSDLHDVLLVKQVKGSLTATPEYKAGLYHVQDKASALVGHVAVAKGALHVDLTGGPGGKVTHLAQLEDYSVACEVSPPRCALIRTLARRVKVNVDTVLCDSRLSPLSLRKPTVLLVDPPCSNLGRLCYEPEVKLWVNKERLEEFIGLQRALIKAAAEAAPRGSLIIYSACTFTRDECEHVVEEACKQGLEPVDQRPFIGIATTPGRKAQRLYPHLHNTAGFYIAKLAKE
ncbi:MAG: hypothetical protein DRJ97_00085 [Thermoprotei archaeon]|nr:MAG: hypothetical protein DRJ97_00085 [Thermoprotei archaeon]